jgi:multiple sugar transport system substrate-binding protein
VNGSVPMFVGGPWEIGSLKQAGGNGFASKYAVAKIPAGKSSTSFMGGSILGVPKTSKNPQAAWKLIQYLTKPSTQVEWYKLAGDLPSQQSAWDNPTLKSDPKVAVFGQQLKSVKVPPAISAWTQVSAAADTSQEQVFVGGTSPEDAMKSLQAKAESIGTAK